GIASQPQALKHEVSWEASGARSSVTAGHSAVVRRPKKEAASWQTRVASNRSNSPRGEASGRILPVAHPGIPVPHAIHPIKVGAGGVDQQVRVVLEPVVMCRVIGIVSHRLDQTGIAGAHPDLVVMDVFVGDLEGPLGPGSYRRGLLVEDHPRGVTVQRVAIDLHIGGSVDLDAG